MDVYIAMGVRCVFAVNRRVPRNSYSLSVYSYTQHGGKFGCSSSSSLSVMHWLYLYVLMWLCNVNTL